jgi:hypothetical protein
MWTVIKVDSGERKLFPKHRQLSTEGSSLGTDCRSNVLSCHTWLLLSCDWISLPLFPHEGAALLVKCAR